MSDVTTLRVIKPVKAVCYYRHSWKPNDRTESIETQRQYCREYAEKHGLAVIGEFEDRKVSGKQHKNRPGLLDAIRSARGHRAVLLCYSLSRLSRNTEFRLKLATMPRLQIRSVKDEVNTSSAGGWLAYAMKSVIDEFERRQTGERVSDAKKRMVKNGRRFGGLPAPFGQRVDPNDSTRFIVDEAEQAGVDEIRRLHAETGMGRVKLAAEMTARGIMGRGGKPWKPGQVARVIAG